MSNSLNTTIENLLRSRTQIIYIVSHEEERIQDTLRAICDKKGIDIYSWTFASGLKYLDGSEKKPEPCDPLKVLTTIQSNSSGLYILKDYHAFLEDAQIVRMLKDLYDRTHASYKPVVIISPILKIPVELEKMITVVDYDLPTYDEIVEQVQAACAAITYKKTDYVALTGEELHNVVRACQGLTVDEISDAIAKSFVEFGDIRVQPILNEKKQIIRKTEILEYCDHIEDFNNVGGLTVLKDWFRKRGIAFTEAAREFGLPVPKGVMLLGHPGNGKSYVCNSLASLWKVPLLRLDVGKVMSGRVGSSENNMRRVIKMVESVAPCILMIDEIEKGFSGTASSNYSDAGTTARVFGTFIQWLNDKTSPVFVVATANSVKELPPELLRKGRFDDVFFVDLPSEAERKEIFKIHLTKRGRKPETFDLDMLAKMTEGFSGSEIEHTVVDALYDIFFSHEGKKDISDNDIATAIRNTTPLSQMAKEKFEELREWAKDRAKFASGAIYSKPKPVPQKVTNAFLRQ